MAKLNVPQAEAIGLTPDSEAYRCLVLMANKMRLKIEGGAGTLIEGLPALQEKNNRTPIPVSAPAVAQLLTLTRLPYHILRKMGKLERDVLLGFKRVSMDGKETEVYALKGS